MQFSFLGYSVNKIMELNLDIKDITILRYFDDFRNSGKMNYEVVEGIKYYWISYQSIENELPFLRLGKRSIMKRMFKLRDLGVLSHYTKKEGGTFSFYAFGDKYYELMNPNVDNNKNTINNIDNNIDNNSSKNSNDNINSYSETLNYGDSINTEENIYMGKRDGIMEEEGVPESEESILNNEDSMDELANLYAKNPKNEQGVFLNKNRGCAPKGRTKTNLLNNSSTIITNIYNIQSEVSRILDYLNSKVNTIYKTSNTKTISLIKARLREGFNFHDFKNVIDKKVREWRGTSFEQYLTPFTLFGDKFEIYLNQNKKSYGHIKNLGFHNFKGRDYDYDALEKKLLGWD